MEKVDIIFNISRPSHLFFQAIFKVKKTDAGTMVRSTSLEELPSCCEEDEGEWRARSSSGVHDTHDALISKLSADWGMSKSYQFSSVVRHTDCQTAWHIQTV